MYDVFERKQQEDTLILYCVPDKKETALVQHFLPQIKKEVPLDKNRLPHAVINLVLFLAEKSVAAGFYFPLLLYYVDFICLLPHTYSNVIKPPPRTATV